MLIFTNRVISSGATAESFGRAFTPGSKQLGVATIASSGSGWKLSAQNADVSDDVASKMLEKLFQGTKPVLLYVHGYNNSPAACFRRIHKLQDLYPGAVVIGFSWPAEGFQSDGLPLPALISATTSTADEEDLSKIKPDNRTKGFIQNKIRQFHQAQTNGKDSVEAFARLLRLIAAVRLKTNNQPFSLAIHSLGTHLFQYSLQAEGATESAGAAYNVAFLAPCVRAAAHKEWVTLFRPKGRTYIAYNRGDTVLFGASIADGNQVKLGAEPGTDRVKSNGVRYISFSDAKLNGGGHGYFVSGVKGKSLELFSRIFTSQSDFEVNESPKVVYPIGCDVNGTTCYMAVPQDQIPQA